MSTSTCYNEGLPGTTSLPPALRRSKSRLPLSTVASNSAPSSFKPKIVAPENPKALLANSRQPSKHDQFASSRSASDHLPKPTSHQSIPRSRNTGAARSGLSISTSSTSGSHVPQSSHRYPPASSATPSLVSGSSISASESIRSPLRRRAPTIDGYATRLRSDPDGVQEYQELFSPVQEVCDDDPFPGAIFGMTLPPTTLQSSKTQFGQSRVVGTRRRMSQARPDEDGARLEMTQKSSAMHEISAVSPLTETSFSFLPTPPLASYSPAMTREKTKRLPSGGGEMPKGERSIPKRNLLASSIEDSSKVPTNLKPAPTFTTRGRTQHKVHDKRSSQQLARIPPELAHLNVDPPAVSPDLTRLPPRRPSRDDTPDLGQMGNSPIVHSDLPALWTTLPKRTPPVKTPVSVKSPSGSSRKLFGFSNRSSSRQDSSRTDSAMSRAPDSAVSSEDEIGRHDSPMFSIVTSPKKSSRFDFICKRPKEPTAPFEKPERARRRGPTAGTGHEGYNKLGFRNHGMGFFGGAFSRSSSADSAKNTGKRSFFGRKSSMTSDDEGTFGDFLKERASPVILRGNGKTPRPQTPPPKAPEVYDEISVSPLSKPLSPSNVRESPVSPPSSLTEYSFGNRATNLEALYTGRVASSAYGETPQVTEPSSKSPVKDTVPPTMEENRERDRSRTNTQSPHKRLPSPSNFARRLLRRSSSNRKRYADIAKGETSESSAVHVDLGHYALDGADRPVSVKEIQTLVNMTIQSPMKHIRLQKTGAIASPVPFEDRHKDFMPSPPFISEKRVPTDDSTLPETTSWEGPTTTPRVLTSRKMTPAQSPQLVNISHRAAKPRSSSTSVPRLSPVGRIPQVISSTNRIRRLPDRSFSRPFTSRQPQSSPGAVNQESGIEEDNSMRHGSLDQRIGGLDSSNGDKVDPVPQSSLDQVAHTTEQFIAFPSRNNSDLSYTSSSGIGSPNIVYAKLDSLPRDLSNDMCNDQRPENKTQTPQDIDTAQASQLPETAAQEGSSRQHLAADHLQASNETINSAYRLSRFASSTNAPSTAFSISDYLGEGDRTSKTSNSEAGPETLGRRSLAKGTPASTLQPDKRESVVSQSDRAGPNASNTSIETLGSHSESHAITGEFRHAALVTSKWLTFGRVLFSPIHDEAKEGNGARVLILDGLGKEWSYYCALNYPGCQFYHLGPEPSASASEAVPNYRHIPQSSLSAAFPFPRGFFAGVVMRFPKIASGECYHTCVSEIKRTLRPGGYLEMSTVDLDLDRMGSRARKAIKDLKVRLHQTDDQLSLWNQGDAFLRLLGRRGFEGIHRCIVALPAAGRVSRSEDSGGSRCGSQPTTPSPQLVEKEVEGPGLVDLLRNRSDDEHLDEQITKTVAKVGRWWYSTCYEEEEISDGVAESRSLWTTPGLLREMERQGTSLRLLICYAQKPTCAKRRTASV